MVYNDIIRGKTVTLRAVECSDAEFITQIRNSDLAQYLHAVGTDVHAQERWIEAQRAREGDYYFMMLDPDGRRIGTVGLSSIVGECGETSRFISYGTPVQNIETNMLITDFAFDVVGLTRIEGYVAAANGGVISLQKKFGYVFETEAKEKDDILVRFARLDCQDYKKKRPKIERLIHAAV